VQANPRVSTQFTGHGSRVLHALEAQTAKSFLFEGSEGLALDHFAITYTGTRAEVEERALPFRSGDEVLVEIVEPHMYDVDDAVAKIDGYIISIAGAADSVGQKRMVRIDKVGRTAATALLLDEAGEVIVPAPPRRRRREPRAPKADEVRVRRAQPRAPREQEDGARAPAEAHETAPASALEETREPEQAGESEEATARGGRRRRVGGRRRIAAQEEGETATAEEDVESTADGDGAVDSAYDERELAGVVAGEQQPEDEDEDRVQSKPRRRGRRGGRRRPAAKADAPE